MKLMPFLLIIFFTSACSHNLSLIAREDSMRGEGTADEIGKKVSILLNGKTYTGIYVFGTGAVATSTIIGNTSAKVGSGTVSAQGNQSGTTYVRGTGNGKIFATSSDSDSLRCEFQYNSGSGLGVCEDKSGKIYDLIIHN